jgi:hypothetical protein
MSTPATPPPPYRFRVLPGGDYLHDGYLFRSGQVIATTRDLSSCKYGARCVRVPDATAADPGQLLPEHEKVAFRTNPDGTTRDMRWRPPYDDYLLPY